MISFVKKLFLLLLIINVSACSLNATSFYYTDSSQTQVIYNNQKVTWGTSPVYAGKVLYVPVRDVMDLLDVSVYTNRRTYKTSIKRYSDDYKLEMEEGSPFLTVNGKQYKLPRNVRHIKNRIYVPFYTFMRIMGYVVLKKKDTFYILTEIKKIEQKNNSFIVEASAPFEYKIKYDKSSKKLALELVNSYISSTDKYSKDNNIGINYMILKQSTDKSNSVIWETSFQNNVKYVMYKYQGENVAELEIKNPDYKRAKPLAKTTTKSTKDSLVKTKTFKKIYKKPQTPPKVLFSTKKFLKPSINSIWLPSLKDLPSIDFSVSGKTVVLKKPYVYQNGSIMVPLRKLFEKAGYNIHINHKKKFATVIREDGIDYLISAGSNKIISRGKDRTEKIMDVDAILSGDDIYVPLISFARILGMGIRWDSKKKRVYLNHRVYEVVYEEYEGMKQVTVKSTGIINVDKIFDTTNPDTIYVNIYNANLDVPNPVVKVDGKKIKSYRLAQLNDNLCRLVIDTKGKIPYGVIADDKVTQGTIRFAAGLSNIALKSAKDISQLVFNSSSKMTPKVVKLSNPARLVIDIPDTVLKVPQMFSGDDISVKSVRASQFKWNPLVTRIVVDLKSDINYRVEKSKDYKKFSIFMSKAKLKKRIDTKPLKPVVAVKKKYSSSLKGKLIAIEAGHGGIDSGAVGKKGTFEKHLALSTSQYLKEELLSRGARVIMCRESDVFMSLNSRVIMANKNRADLYISVHYNSFTNRNISGTETYYFKSKDYWAANYVHKAMVKTLRRTDRGLRKVPLYVLKRTSMPAILIEPVFLSNKWDELLARNSNFQKKIAVGVANGLENYYNFMSKRGKK